MGWVTLLEKATEDQGNSKGSCPMGPALLGPVMLAVAACPQPQHPVRAGRGFIASSWPTRSPASEFSKATGLAGKRTAATEADPPQ